MKTILGLFFMIGFFYGCNNLPNDKEVMEQIELDWNNKVDTFCDSFDNISISLDLKQYDDELLIMDVIFAEPHVVYPPYQRWIVDNIMTNIIEIQDTTEKFISIFLDEEKGKAETLIKYPVEYYDQLKIRKGDRINKKIAWLCFEHLDQIMPFDLRDKTEVVIFKRYPTDEGTKFNLIDILQNSDLERELFLEHNMTLEKLLEDLIKIYSYDKKDYDKKDTDVKIAIFLKELLPLIKERNYTLNKM
jgi:hypothetical protein